MAVVGAADPRPVTPVVAARMISAVPAIMAAVVAVVTAPVIVVGISTGDGRHGEADGGDRCKGKNQGFHRLVSEWAGDDAGLPPPFGAAHGVKS